MNIIISVNYNNHVQEIVILPHVLKGKGANHSDLSEAGFTSSGIGKGSVGSNMMSHAYQSGSGKGVVSTLQSAGARGHGVSGE